VLTPEIKLREVIRMYLRILSLVATTAFFPGCRSQNVTSNSSAPVREVSVAAAADLNFALDEVIREFEKKQPTMRVHVAYGSSGNFYSQLTNQAPFDLFLSADVEYPRKLSQRGLTLPDTEFVYGVGRIAIWAPKGSPIDVEKLHIDALKHSRVTHIAIANPQHAPYGRAAEAAMRSLGVYDAVKSKLVLGENISQALQFVQSGNAEIGIVALSLVMAPAVRDQGRSWEVPLASYPRIDQGGVILKGAKDADAARTFRGFLMDSEGRSILKKYGFSVPGE
jgi:molybdate transport system substrate-binding protein